MALSDPRAGLNRPGVRLVNRTADVAKASIVVQPGSELEVDDDLAAQLLRAGGFTLIGNRAVAEQAAEGVAAAPSAPPIEEAGGGSARRTSGRRKG